MSVRTPGSALCRPSTSLPSLAFHVFQNASHNLPRRTSGRNHAFVVTQTLFHLFRAALSVWCECRPGCTSPAASLGYSTAGMEMTPLRREAGNSREPTGSQVATRNVRYGEAVVGLWSCEGCMHYDPGVSPMSRTVVEANRIHGTAERGRGPGRMRPVRGSGRCLARSIRLHRAVAVASPSGTGFEACPGAGEEEFVGGTLPSSALPVGLDDLSLRRDGMLDSATILNGRAHFNARHARTLLDRVDHLAGVFSFLRRRGSMRRGSGP